MVRCFCKYIGEPLNNLEEMPVERLPEPEMIMKNREDVLAYTEGGLSGRLSGVYGYHAATLPPLLPNRGLAIDLGCGSGINLFLLAEKLPNWEFHGIELSEGMLSIAKKLWAKLPSSIRRRIFFHKDDLTNPSSITSRSANLVSCFYTLHHLPNVKVLSEALKTVSRVVHPGGAIYLFDFSRPKNRLIESFWIKFTTRGYDPVLKEEFIQSLKASWKPDEIKGLLPDGTSLFSSGLHFLGYRPHENGQTLPLHSRLRLYFPISSVEPTTLFKGDESGKRSKLRSHTDISEVSR
ncbi:class I SAM-dependent methyltransferase [Bdellovibrionota bacterium]